MWYQNIVLSLHEPLSASEVQRDVFLPENENESGQKPSYIATRARHCLETLVRLYYLRHGFETLDCFLVQFLNLVGFKVLDWLKSNSAEASQTELLSTLALCARGLRQQGEHYYLVELVYHLLLNNIDPEHTRFLDVLDDTSPDTSRKRLFVAHTQSDYPVKVADIAADPAEWRVDQLLAGVEDMKLDGSHEHPECG